MRGRVGRGLAARAPEPGLELPSERSGDAENWRIGTPATPPPSRGLSSTWCLASPPLRGAALSAPAPLVAKNRALIAAAHPSSTTLPDPASHSHSAPLTFARAHACTTPRSRRRCETRDRMFRSAARWRSVAGSARSHAAQSRQAANRAHTRRRLPARMAAVAVRQQTKSSPTCTMLRRKATPSRQRPRARRSCRKACADSIGSSACSIRAAFRTFSFRAAATRDHRKNSLDSTRREDATAARQATRAALKAHCCRCHRRE